MLDSDISCLKGKYQTKRVLQKKHFVKNISETGVSVIIPAKNESKNIATCIDSIIKQDFIGFLEIIVVDNCSTDNTVQIAKTKGVQVLVTNANSPAGVRNYGSKKAKYEILAFIDGDCEAPTDWISRSVSALKSDDRIGACGGPYRSPTSANWIVKSWSPVSRLEGKIKNKLLPGGNIIVWKSIFEKIDGFDEGLITAEDDDFCHSLTCAGYDIEYDLSRAVIHYGYPDSFKTVFKKSIWHGTTQIKAHGFFGDKLVILTWVWILNFIMISVFLLLHWEDVFIIALSSFLIAPLFLTYIRLKRCPLIYKAKYFISSYVVCFAVLIGRSLGMIRELRRRS